MCLNVRRCTRSYLVTIKGARLKAHQLQGDLLDERGEADLVVLAVVVHVLHQLSDALSVSV